MITTNSEMLTPTEAAIVSSVEVRDVNRVIDESILPKDFYRINPDRTRRSSPTLVLSYLSTSTLPSI